jgi:aminoglycoside phosphotransferase (APT) family kinase protein
MHIDEVPIDTALVHELVAAQFPQWVDLPLTPVESAGTVNVIHRLGDELAVRVPRIPQPDMGSTGRERLLTRLASLLPLPIPHVVAHGGPERGYPGGWTVERWLPGTSADRTPPDDLDAAARDLAGFLATLHAVDPGAAPPAGAATGTRGLPIATPDKHATVQRGIDALADEFGPEVLRSVWQRAVAAPEWAGAPVWFHGDVMPGNVLVEAGRVSAVIDFEQTGAGDPACDMAVGWNLLDRGSRAVLRTALDIDDATWDRGRGWALWSALAAIPYYRDTNPKFVAVQRRTLEQITADTAD